MPSPAPSTSSFSSETELDGGTVGRETRRRLVEWWRKEYCASRMRLCVIGKGVWVLIMDTVSILMKYALLEPLDELAEKVVELFSPIENRGQDPLPMIHEHPYGPSEKGVSSSNMVS